MILNKLHLLAQAKNNSDEGTHRFTIRVGADYMAMLEELAEELGLPRSVVSREALEAGIRAAHAEWQQALDEAKEEKKAARSQAKLKLAGAA